MSARDLTLAITVAFIWGLNFVIVKWGLSEIPPLLFAALRFGAVAALAPLFPRPQLPLRRLLGYGLAWGTLQYAGLFLALGFGLPAGTTSVLVQSQVVFTQLLALTLRMESFSGRRMVSALLAMAGLGVVSSARADHLPLSGLVAAACGAMGWAGGNVLARRLAKEHFRVDTFAFLAWACTIPALSLLGLSLLLEGPRQIQLLVSRFSLVTLSVLAYQSLFALAGGAVVWNMLLRRYTASMVAPFSLLVPVVSIAGSHLAFGETISSVQWLGSALLLAGLADTALLSRGFPKPLQQTAE